MMQTQVQMQGCHWSWPVGGCYGSTLTSWTRAQSVKRQSKARESGTDLPASRPGVSFAFDNCVRQLLASQ